MEYWELFGSYCYRLTSGANCRVGHHLVVSIVINVYERLPFRFLKLFRYPLTQMALVVSQLWGIAYFKELTGTKRILTFFLFVGVIIVGVFLLGLYGSS